MSWQVEGGPSRGPRGQALRVASRTPSRQPARKQRPQPLHHKEQLCQQPHELRREPRAQEEETSTTCTRHMGVTPPAQEVCTRWTRGAARLSPLFSNNYIRSELSMLALYGLSFNLIQTNTLIAIEVGKGLICVTLNGITYLPPGVSPTFQKTPQYGWGTPLPWATV